MILVIADPRDAGARSLVEAWPDARLLTARDLSLPGWRHYAGGARGIDDEQAVASGERVRARDLLGVIVRVPVIADDTLLHIAEPDRAYVAAEMTAFLIAWLSRLPCPVLNRPHAGSLLGPSLGRERWLRLAARAGLKLSSSRQVAPDAERLFAPASATVVSGHALGPVAPALAEQAARLAALAGVELVTVHFTGESADAAFAGAELTIDLARDGVAAALRARFAAGARA